MGAGSGTIIWNPWVQWISRLKEEWSTAADEKVKSEMKLILSHENNSDYFTSMKSSVERFQQIGIMEVQK